MTRYLHLLQYELKTLLRDPMNLFMFIYPVFMLGFVGWLIPTLLVRTGVDVQSNDYRLSMMLLLVLVLAIGGFISGAMLGFSLLENKDDQTLKAIAVSPVTVKGYVWFKSIYSFWIGVLGNLIMVFGIKYFFGDTFSFQSGSTIVGLERVGNDALVYFSLSASLLTPSIGTLIAAIAKNKIEGFAFMKTGGILFMIPLLIVLSPFQNWQQYFLGLAPNFWAVKGIYNLMMGIEGGDNLGYSGYLIIGNVYMLSIAWISANYFLRRANTERSN